MVVTASDGNAAVRGRRELHPDVVLMDVRMPGMDCIEATRQLAGPAAVGRIGLERLPAWETPAECSQVAPQHKAGPPRAG